MVKRDSGVRSTAGGNIDSWWVLTGRENGVYASAACGARSGDGVRGTDRDCRLVQLKCDRIGIAGGKLLAQRQTDQVNRLHADTPANKNNKSGRK